MASDRRLPFALLDETVGQIIGKPFEDLAATPGIGPKKIGALIELLRRVGQQPASNGLSSEVSSLVSVASDKQDFDADLVSELMWEQWRETVRRHGLESECLGRLAPSLRRLPTVIWQKTLGDYLGFTIEELRALKTHGDKRVQAILEVFYTAHRALADAPPSTHLAIWLRPSFIPPIDHWLSTALTEEATPRMQELRQHLVLPLLNQIQRDGDEVVHRLAANRLGVEGSPESVRDQARQLDVTRARVYQLLEVCGEVMEVRWPAGRWSLQALEQKIESESDDAEALSLLRPLRRLLYPPRTRVREMEPAIA